MPNGEATVTKILQAVSYLKFRGLNKKTHLGRLSTKPSISKRPPNSSTVFRIRKPSIIGGKSPFSPSNYRKSLIFNL